MIPQESSSKLELEGYKKLFRYYKQLGDQSIAQLEDESKFFWTPGEESNCIAVIIQHLYGNMKSRWTDFLTTDGEKKWRDRDREFELYCTTKQEVMELWEEGWTCIFTALASINKDNKDQLIYIRNKGHSIDEALQRQLAHYAYHIGQLVYVARMIAGEDFTSLSIPKGQSKSYNKEAFDGGQRKEHFTDLLSTKKKEDTE